MEVTDDRINIFVLGDLVLDHAIFVEPKTRLFQQVGTEQAYEVKRRRTTAGGAANCARALACLSKGRTYLWGIIGPSNWGSFPTLLEASHNYDNAPLHSIFRGLHHETISMNTITRIVAESAEGQKHEIRFDDGSFVSIADFEKASAINHVENAHTDTPLNAIILYDLDMKALSPRLVDEVGRFAREQNIPLFIDPKRHIEKYENVSGTAVLPNLREWCELIGESGNESHWRQNLGTHDGLVRMAQTSLQQLPQFKYHIITCDKDGAIIIGPAEKRNLFDVCHIQPHPPQTRNLLPHQLGCGDILTAVVALQYCHNGGNPNPTRFSEAFDVANAAVACYRKNPWHRMPTRDDLADLTTKPPNIQRKWPFGGGVVFSPKGSSIDLKDVEHPSVSGLYSDDHDFNDEVERVLQAAAMGWEDSNLHSIILTGEGGNGKTLIAEALPTLLTPMSIVVKTFEIAHFSGMTQVVKEFAQQATGLAAGAKGLLFVVDEAFKNGHHLLHGPEGVRFLEEAHKRKIRFFLVDADFPKHQEDLDQAQFLSRCLTFTLPSISDRPRDIAYLFAAACKSQVKNENVSRITCGRETLQAVIDWELAKPVRLQSPRNIFREGKNAAKTGERKGRTLHIRPQDLSKPLRTYLPPRQAGRNRELYTITW